MTRREAWWPVVTDAEPDLLACTTVPAPLRAAGAEPCGKIERAGDAARPAAACADRISAATG